MKVGSRMVATALAGQQLQAALHAARSAAAAVTVADRRERALRSPRRARIVSAHRLTRVRDQLGDIRRRA